MGHLIGDYVLQTDWMAVNKKKWNLEGWIACLIHCLIWSLCITIAINKFSVSLFILIFFSHLIIDKTNIIKFCLNKFKIMPNPTLWKVIIVDNAIHLLILLLIL